MSASMDKRAKELVLRTAITNLAASLREMAGACLAAAAAAERDSEER